MRVSANGLQHHVVTWGDRNGSPVVLLHGFMDAGGTWDLVAPHLVSAGYFVVAPDLRGFGLSDRVPRGGYYHFPDYVADLAQLVDALELKSFRLVGHSMGGTIASLYSGVCGDRIASLAIIEGVGPPDNIPEVAPDRMARWLKDLRATDVPRTMTMDTVIARLSANHPEVPADVLSTRAKYLVREASGGFEWAYDPLHRTTSPMPFLSAIYRAFASCAACPVLFVSGGTKGWHPPDESERLSAFKNLSRVDIEGAGHMVHWTRPSELAKALLDFFDA